MDLTQAARCASAHQGGSGEGEDRALLLAGIRNQSAVHHGGRERAEAHSEEADPRRRWSNFAMILFERTIRPVKACLKDAKLTEKEINELVLVGGMTRMPKVIETARKLDRQGTAQRREPGRSGGGWRGDSGRRAQGRRQRRAAARRDAVDAGDRNGGWRGHADDSAQHHDPDPEVADLFDLQRQSAGRGDQGVAGRTSAFPRQQESWHVPSRWNSAGPARRSADRSDLRHRRERHPARLGEGSGTGKEQKISITGSCGLSKEEVEKMQQDAEPHAEEDKKAKEAIEIKNNADNAGLSEREAVQGSRATRFPATRRSKSKTPSPRCAKRSMATTPRR